MGMPDQTIEFRYDTQLLLDQYVEDGVDPDDLADDLTDEIREYVLENIKGDSMVIAGDSGEDEFGEKATVKLHYHTNEPWDVLASRWNLWHRCRRHGQTVKRFKGLI